MSKCFDRSQDINFFTHIRKRGNISGYIMRRLKFEDFMQLKRFMERVIREDKGRRFHTAFCCDIEKCQHMNWYMLLITRCWEALIAQACQRDTWWLYIKMRFENPVSNYKQELKTLLSHFEHTIHHLTRDVPIGEPCVMYAKQHAVSYISIMFALNKSKEIWLAI